MGLGFGKIFAIVIVPLSILIFLEATGIYQLSTPFDKVLIGSILMIALQLTTTFFVKMKYKENGDGPTILFNTHFFCFLFLFKI